MTTSKKPTQHDLPGMDFAGAYDAKLDKLRADLHRIRAELNELQTLADEAGLSPRRRFSRYLDTLDRKESDIRDAIDGVERPNERVVRSIERGVKEAWQRLAIAKTAAEARFH